MRQDPKRFDCRLIATAQHRELLDQVLGLFGLDADADFNVMKADQSLSDLTANLLQPLDKLLDQEKPDWVLAEGDTTTVFVAALSSFYRRIRFGHVEAGLRTGNKYFPYPEEINRVLTGQLADLHFAPTERAQNNLLSEGIKPQRIVVTGNTVIDALLHMAEKNFDLPFNLSADQRLILVTAHRRENFGQPLREICEALLALVKANEDLQIVFPVHPNPKVKSTVHDLLAKHPRILLVEPMNYQEFVTAMKKSTLIISDSGGVQEEAPSLGKPVLVLRDETERPEAVDAGTVKLVGPHREIIVKECQRLLDDPRAYQKMAQAINPYGDGKAAERICAFLAGEKVKPFVYGIAE